MPMAQLKLLRETPIMNEGQDSFGLPILNQIFSPFSMISRNNGLKNHRLWLVIGQSWLRWSFTTAFTNLAGLFCLFFLLDKKQ